MEFELQRRRMEGVPLLRGILDEFGPERTWQAVKSALGFPPEWVSTHKEALRVREAAEKGKHDGID